MEPELSRYGCPKLHPCPKREDINFNWMYYVPELILPRRMIYRVLSVRTCEPGWTACYQEELPFTDYTRKWKRWGWRGLLETMVALGWFR